MMDDTAAWKEFPEHQNWFNKLWLSQMLGYHCGPAGTAPEIDGTYVIRPVMNLSGMGVGAHVKEIKAGDQRSVPAGYFWCEYFDGDHYSVDLEWEWDRDKYSGKWQIVNCWKGTNYPVNLTKFEKWERTEFPYPIHHLISNLSNVGKINIECINGLPIEVHLRHSPDPDYDEMIPVWSSDLGIKKAHMEMHGYQFVNSYDDADGQLDDPRIGFLVK